MQQVMLIHGGDTFDKYEDYLAFLKTREFNFEKHGLGQNHWQANLAQRLGDQFQVVRPEMPSKWNAKYEEWKIWFERFFPFLQDEVILVGSSLGGSFLAKYLAQNDFPKKIKAVFLVAGAFGDNEPQWKLYDFWPPENLEKFSAQAEKVFLYHSQDDHVVPFEHGNKFKQALSKATFRIFDDRGHFNQAELPELVEDIKHIA